IGALRGPKHGGANEVSLEIQQRYETPDEAEADIRKRVENKEVAMLMRLHGQEDLKANAQAVLDVLRNGTAYDRVTALAARG
ncbi:hypothetical protein MJH54_08810, partial [Salmonella enterica subsp. enterica serovar Montevideo]|nr:hypothetical protein [Salmonella enterica subsp. enterica serovar Montevideo]